MWAGLPWPRLTEDEGEESAGARLSRCVASLRSSGIVQPGGICTSLEVHTHTLHKNLAGHLLQYVQSMVVPELDSMMDKKKSCIIHNIFLYSPQSVFAHPLILHSSAEQQACKALHADERVPSPAGVLVSWYTAQLLLCQLSMESISCVYE